MTEYVAIYHDPCPDGFTSYYYMYRWVSKQKGAKLQGFPATFNENRPSDLGGKHVFFLDFTYKSIDLMREIINEAERVTIIDHHYSAEERVNQLAKEFPAKLEVVFDKERSGAGLTHGYFFPKAPLKNPKTGFPNLAHYVEDRDLGFKFKCPYYRQVSAYIDSVPFTIGSWSSLSYKFNSSPQFNDMVNIGGALMRYKEKIVAEAISHSAAEIQIDNEPVPCAQTIPSLGSQTAMKLLEMFPDAPYAVAYYVDTKKGGVNYSLRTKSNSVNVAEICEKLGGGGHKQAAGCTVSVQDHQKYLSAALGEPQSDLTNEQG